MPRFKELKPEPPKPAKPPRAAARPGAPSAYDPSADTSITRRTFALGAGIVAAIAGAVGFVASRFMGLRGGNESDTAGAPVVVDSGDATNITEEFEQVDAIRLQQRAQYELPLGSILAPAEGIWVPVVQPGATTSAVCAAGALRITDGEVVSVVPQPIVNGPNALILDARCSDAVYAWSEVDISQRTWVLYASAWKDGAFTGKITTLWEGDADWDPPAFVCTGNQVLWQIQPALSGTKTTEFSGLYRWRSGDSSAEKIYESQGRFACEPSVSRNVVTIVPRVTGEGNGVYYGLTALDKSDFTKVVDTLVMPQSVRPYRACRIGDQFAFAVEATYGTGGLLSNMGYYLGTADGRITWLSREPAAGVWGSDGAYAFKARASYIVYDSLSSQFSVLLATDRSVDYGEYPAATGDTSTFVTFSTVKDATTGYPAKVCVRVYDTVSPEEAERIWRASLPVDDENYRAYDDFVSGDGAAADGSGVAEGTDGADASASDADADAAEAGTSADTADATA